MNELSDSPIRMMLGRYLLAFNSMKLYLAATPVVVVLVGLAVLLLHASLVPAEIRSRYLEAAREAMANDRIDLSKIYYGRLLEEGQDIGPQDQMNWASILAANGEGVAAQRVIERLAPDGRPGYGPAHRQRAIQLVSGVSTSTDPKHLELLQFHLKNIGSDQSPEVNKMWAAFYFAVGQPKAALSRLQAAAAKEPGLWLGLAGLAKQLSEENVYRTALKNAETHYLAALEKNPFDAESRDLVSRVYIASERVEEAQAIIDQGLKLQDIPAIHRSAANILLYRFDELRKKENSNFDTANRLLAAAFGHDPNYPEIYNRLVQMYQELESESERMALRANLEALVAEGNVTPFAHFSLGSIDWLQGEQDQALWHLEKAYELDSNLLNVANNLAWVLAVREPADLGRAYAVAKSVVERAPDQVRFRDTFATILMKQERWDEAVVEFERILAKSSDKQRIHANLAIIYEALGRQSLADLHRDQAQAGG